MLRPAGPSWPDTSNKHVEVAAFNERHDALPFEQRRKTSFTIRSEAAIVARSFLHSRPEQ